MPFYLYYCESCKEEFLLMKKISERNLEQKCERCPDSLLKRKVEISSFKLKGGGWYNEGYERTSD